MLPTNDGGLRPLHPWRRSALRYSRRRHRRCPRRPSGRSDGSNLRRRHDVVWLQNALRHEEVHEMIELEANLLHLGVGTIDVGTWRARSGAIVGRSRRGFVGRRVLTLRRSEGIHERLLVAARLGVGRTRWTCSHVVPNEKGWSAWRSIDGMFRPLAKLSDSGVRLSRSASPPRSGGTPGRRQQSAVE